MTEFSSAPEDILAAPIALQPTTREGVETWTSEPFQVHLESRGRATWSVHSSSARFDLHTTGGLEYDGMLDYRLELIAREDVDLIDIALPIALMPDAARYMLGTRPAGRASPRARSTGRGRSSITRRASGSATFTRASSMCCVTRTTSDR